MNRRHKGLGLEIAGVIILLAGLFLQQFLREEHKNFDTTEYLCLLILAWSLVVGGGASYMMGRKLRVRLAEEVLKPGEPYILYLRSFAADEETARVAPSPWRLILGLIGSSEEEKLAKTLRVIARGVAVGKPGEKLPERGFYRAYVKATDWLSEVKKRMQEARLVLVRIGDSEGLLEEMKVAREILKPEQLVLIVPRESNLVRTMGELDTGLQLQSHGPYGARTELTLCPGLTVPIMRVTSGEPEHTFVGIIYFDSSWRAHAQPLSIITISLTQSIDRAFKPVYKQLGIRKGIRLYKVILILVGLGLVGVITFLIYSSWQHHHPKF